MFNEMTLKEINEAGRKITEAFRELKDKLLKVLSESFESLEESIQKIFKKIEEHKRLLHRPPKWYSKVSNPAMIVNKSKLYHCRNNC